MAILENIRKRTTVLILIIGLALFAFVISGVIDSSGFSGGTKVGSSVAEINGKEISIDAFRNKVENYSSRMGGNVSGIQAVNQVWDQEVRNAILNEQIENLGIDIEQDQIMNYIKNLPSYAQSPQFQNENGVFDEQKFRDFIADMRTNNPAQYQLWLQDEENIIQNAKQQVYFNLIKAGMGATLKEGEFDYKLANDKMDIKYVRVPFSSIADTTITVTKSEIAQYIKDHPEEFKQAPARDLQFVLFEEKASKSDEDAIKDAVTKLIEDNVTEAKDTTYVEKQFRNTTDMIAFLDRNSDTKFDTIFKPKNQLPTQFADTLMGLAIGEVFGPYRDGDSFKASRMMARRPNGSVKSSHILFSYKGATRAGADVTRTKEEAEKKAKEVFSMVKANTSDFAEYAKEHSDGPSGPNGGELGFYTQGQLAPEYNDFIFGNSVGSVDLVETDFGFHIIKVDEKQDLVQIATLAREIEASEETINQIFTDATKFEMDATSSDGVFTDLAKEANFTARPVNKIKAMDENLPGLGSQRAMVQWAFNGDTKVGDIKRFNLTNGYAVAQLTGTYDEGLMSVEDASATVLPKIRKERKATQIIGANQGKSLEDFAKDNSVSVSNATALTVKAPTIPGAGSEPAVVGSAYTLSEGQTSGLITGETGIFMVSVTKREEAPALDNYSTYANSLKSSNAARVNTDVYNALKEASEIEDKRATFY